MLGGGFLPCGCVVVVVVVLFVAVYVRGRGTAFALRALRRPSRWEKLEFHLVRDVYGVD